MEILNRIEAYEGHGEELSYECNKDSSYHRNMAEGSDYQKFQTTLSTTPENQASRCRDVFESMLLQSTVMDSPLSSNEESGQLKSSPSDSSNLSASFKTLEISKPGSDGFEQMAQASCLDTPSPDGPRANHAQVTPRSMSTLASSFSSAMAAQMNPNQGQLATSDFYLATARAFERRRIKLIADESSETSVANDTLRNPNEGDGEEVPTAQLIDMASFIQTPLSKTLASLKSLNKTANIPTTTNAHQLSSQAQDKPLLLTNSTTSCMGGKLEHTQDNSGDSVEVNPSSLTAHAFETRPFGHWGQESPDATHSTVSNWVKPGLAYGSSSPDADLSRTSSESKNSRSESTSIPSSPNETESASACPFQNAAIENQGWPFNGHVPLSRGLFEHNLDLESNCSPTEARSSSWMMNDYVPKDAVMDNKQPELVSPPVSSNWMENFSKTAVLYPIVSRDLGHPESSNQIVTSKLQMSPDTTRLTELSENSQEVVLSPRFCRSHPTYPATFYCSFDSIAVCCICTIEGLGSHSHEGYQPVPIPSSSDDGSARLRNVQLLEKSFNKILKRLASYGEVQNTLVMFENNHFIFNTSKFEDFPTLCMSIQHFNELLVMVSHSENHYDGFENAIRRCFRTFMIVENASQQSVHCHIPVTGEQSGQLPTCFIEGQGTFESVVGCTTSFFVVVNDFNGAPCDIGTFPLDINVRRISNDEKKVAVSTRQYKEGVLQVLTRFDRAGSYTFSIRINGTEVREPKMVLHVKDGYNALLGMKSIKEVSIPALYNRKLRVCLNDLQEIFFSDQVQNCFEVWSSDFTRCLPSTALTAAFGNFSEPSGIAINHNNELVICDSGNDRICVFSFSKGVRQSPRSANLFNPTSVLVNASNEYIILHSGRKICVMSPDFQHVTHLDLTETKPNLDAWGICLGYLGEIFVTDCNSGDVLVVDLISKVSKVAFTCNGGGHVYTRRSMRGIAINNQGYFIVADYGNSFIEVYSQTGHFMERYPVQRKPLDIAVLRNSRFEIIVTREGAPPILFGHV